jgi:hypothetical protein
MAIDDIVTFSSVDDLEQDPPASVPEVDDVIGLGDGEGGFTDPTFLITSVVNNGSHNYTLVTTQTAAGDYPVTDDVVGRESPLMSLILLADATGAAPSGFPTDRVTHTRLVAVGNNQFWYEDI